MKSFQHLNILIDNPKSWIWGYLREIRQLLDRYAEQVMIFRKCSEVTGGDILFLLSCDRIISSKTLSKHKHNIVIHESDLPLGKGWSPLSWQVESSCNEIPVTLFEATEELDSGHWYLKDKICLDGDELVDDIREKQARKTLALIERFLANYPLPAHPQKGEESLYPKRTIKDQELDINSTIAAQFNLLRVCDNERYPAHFYVGGRKYIVKIYQEDK